MLGAYEGLCGCIFSLLGQLAKEAERSGEEKDSINASVMTIQNCHQLHMAVKGLQMTSLESISKLAKQEYDRHLHEYAHLCLQRVLGVELVAFVEDLSRELESTAATEIAFQTRFNKQTAKRILPSLNGKDLRKGLEALLLRIQKHFREEPGLITVIWGRVQEEMTTLIRSAHETIAQVYATALAEIRLTLTVDEVARLFTEIKR